MTANPDGDHIGEVNEMVGCPYRGPFGCKCVDKCQYRAAPAHPDGVRLLALADDELAGWARNWHWNDCASDQPVDPSIYFRDMRMLKAFIDHCRAAPVPQCDAEPVAWRWRFDKERSWTLCKSFPSLGNDADVACEPLYAAPSRLDAEGVTVPIEVLRNCGCPADFRSTIGQCEDSGQCGCSINLSRRIALTPPALAAGEQVRRIERLEQTIRDSIEALERNSTSAPVVECLKAALSPSSNGKPAI